MLLVVLLVAGQFPAARTVWQDLRKSTHLADKETTTAKGRLQLVLDHRYPVQQASIVQVGSILGLAGVLLINWILRRRMSSRQQRTAMAAAGTSAGARLLRLELLATRQSQALIAAERQITKLNTRARLLGRDLQPPLRQVQAENLQQAEALVRITNKLESLDTDLRDTQQLLGALHGATAKQLQLVMQALQLSQAAKALAQSVAAAVEKDREAGMGLPRQGSGHAKPEVLHSA
ncbi:g10270 [Coccomyxa elongata]